MKRVTLVSSAFTFACIAGLTALYLSKPPHTQIPVPSARTARGQVAAQGNSIIGASRPDFSLTDVNGQVHNISEWDGKVIAINFWATWCPPCIKEIPEFVELQHKYEEQGLQFIGIALQRAEEVTDFIAEQGMNYPVLVGEMEVINISESYGNDIGALPYTVIVDRKGNIHYVKRGPLPGADAEAIISNLL